MSNARTALASLLCSLFVLVVPCLHGATLEYSAKADAYAAVGWYDPSFAEDFDLPVEDVNETANQRCYAGVSWREMEYFGQFDISISTVAAVEPNGIVLTNELSGSYEFDFGSDLLDRFSQQAQCLLEGTLTIDEFPPGTPCSIHFESVIPHDTWTADYYWRFHVASEWEEVACGRAVEGSYGPSNGSITAFAGRPVQISFAGLAEGYAEARDKEGLGWGGLRHCIRLTVTRRVADFDADGWVNFQDFARFASQWSPINPGDPQVVPPSAADLDGDGLVGIHDLKGFARCWLLAAPALAAEQMGPAGN